MATTDTDWIQPGAEIVVYSRELGRDSAPRKTTVKTRAKQSFTVEGIDKRFSLDKMETKPNGSWMLASTWAALHPNDDYARKLFETDRKQRLVSHATIAVGNWQRDRTRKNRLAAIEALKQVED